MPGDPPQKPSGTKQQNVIAIALAWGQTEIPVEVKSDAPRMMVQARRPLAPFFYREKAGFGHLLQPKDR
jgi:hypothetical protein